MADVYQIAQAYRNILGQEPDAAGLAYWANSGQDIGTIAKNIQLNKVEQVANLYQQAFGRAPDSATLQHWAYNNQPLSVIANNFGVAAPPVASPANVGQVAAEVQQAIAPQSKVPKAPDEQYSIKAIQTGAGGDAGYNTEYAIVDKSGKSILNVLPNTNDYGEITGFYADIGTSGGDAGGTSSFVPIDINTINAKLQQGFVPFGQGMGPALGYDYEMTNANGDVFRRFDAQGNLTEFLDKDGKFQPASSFKPTGFTFNPATGNVETTYKSPNSPRANITESTATTVNPYKEDQSGFLGEGGWQNLAKLALTGLSAGFAAPAMAALQGAGLGSIASGALYGGLTGAAGGAISGGGKGALQGGLLGAAGGGIMGALGGGGPNAIPVEAPNSNFTGLDAGDFGSWGVGEFQPFAGGDVGLGSGMITQFNPNGTFATLAGAPDASDFTYTVEDDLGNLSEAGSIESEKFDPNARVLTAEEAENLMLYDILPADLQTPASFSLIDSAKALLGGDYGSLIKGGLTLGGLAAASALKQNSQPTSTGSTGLTSGELQQIVSGMPSMVDKYNSGAAIPGVPVAGGPSQINAGYNQGMTQSLANLFPTFSLPTQGPFYGAGRFGNNYAPAPITSLV